MQRVLYIYFPPLILYKCTKCVFNTNIVIDQKHEPYKTELEIQTVRWRFILKNKWTKKEKNGAGFEADEPRHVQQGIGGNWGNYQLSQGQGAGGGDRGTSILQGHWARKCPEPPQQRHKPPRWHLRHSSGLKRIWPIWDDEGTKPGFNSWDLGGVLTKEGAAVSYCLQTPGNTLGLVTDCL